MNDGIATTARGVSRFSAGLRFHQAGEIALAEECYRHTLAKQPDHADALHLLGVAALQLGRPDEAIPAIQEAIALQPGTAEYHNSLASAYKELGRAEEAVAEYRRCIELKPEYAVAQHNLGVLLAELNCSDEAAECLQLADELLGEHLSSLESAASDAAPSGPDSPPQFTRVDAGVEAPEVPSPVSEITRKTVLHVGCGPRNAAGLHERFRGPEWREVRLDIDPGVAPDVVASLTDMPAIDGDSVDAVYSAHNLEHLYAHEVPRALAEFHRVLRPGGQVLVTMPDLQQLAHYIAADKLDDEIYVSPIGPITTLDCVFGYGKAIAGGNPFMAHKTGFTATSLRRRLEEAGFVDVTTWTNPFSLWAEAHKPPPAP